MSLKQKSKPHKGKSAKPLKLPPDLYQKLVAAKVGKGFIHLFVESYNLFGYCGAKLHVTQFIWFKENYDLSDEDTLTVMRSGVFPTKKISPKRRRATLVEWLNEVADT